MAIAPTDGLAAAVKGRVVDRGDAGYDEARALYNGMIDKHPAAVVYCADAGDVAAGIKFATDRDLRIAVRCGGHNGAGLGSVDEGIVLDLSELNDVTVDQDTKTAKVQGGARLGQVDAAAHHYSLAVPAGVISTTGVGGLTLGGGVGHLTRKCGLTIDNLIGARVVLADGSTVEADEEREPDLFWALRGGGGNFGVVTEFRFRCHDVGTVDAGPVIYDLGDAGDVLRWYREFMPAQPDELSGFFAFLSIPPGPPFPEELHLRPVCAIVWCHTGEPDSPALREARSYGNPIVDGIAPVPFPAWNSAFDGVYPPGDQWYWRGESFGEISDDAIEEHVKYGNSLPSWKSTMHLYPVDGAAGRVPSDATAWPHRDAVWTSVVGGVDPDPANADAITDWTKRYSDALRPHSLGRGYVNFQMQETGDRVRAMYGDNYDRLARTKAKYDPGNVFRVNQNIEPA